MTKEILASAIGEIDLKLIDDAVKTDKKNNIKFFKAEYAVVAAVFVLVIGAAIFFLGRSPKISGSSIEQGFGENTLSVQSDLFDESKDCGGNQKGILTPAEVTGNGYTDEQLRSYVEENKNTVMQIVIAEYGEITGELRIYTKGYCHASMGEKNIVDRNYVTLPVTLDGKIIATMEIYTVDGVILDSLNIGGDTWDKRNRVFEENPQGDIVFAWYGEMFETAVNEDNKIYTFAPEGDNSLQSSEDWYSLLKTEYNTFSAEDFNDPDNYISVVSTPDAP